MPQPTPTQYTHAEPTRIDPSSDGQTGVALSAGTGAKVLSARPCNLASIYITAALVGTLTITGLVDETGSAAPYVLPIGTVGNVDFGDARCSSLSLQKSSASDDGKVFANFRVI